ncbi:MAG: hypothetical protein EOO09_16820 [Chitinophagaceae bacterium]|nr:MAG: hypothetical protein EOO09_16820 [Chitinophagaceae bacterium]
MNDKKWHCVYTKPGCEKRVADHLTKKGLETYYPTSRKRVGSSSARKPYPIFRSYVFVRMAESDSRVVMRADSVLSFVHWLGKPVVVRDNEIQLMRMFIAEHSHVLIEKTKVNASEMVRIVTDHSNEFGSNIAFAFTNPVKIIVPTLGYAIIADAPAGTVETFSPSRIAVNQDWQMANPS